MGLRAQFKFTHLSKPSRFDECRTARQRKIRVIGSTMSSRLALNARRRGSSAQKNVLGSLDDARAMEKAAQRFGVRVSLLQAAVYVAGNNAEDVRAQLQRWRTGTRG